MRRIALAARPQSVGRRAVVILGTLAVAFMLSGCSVANLTGFDFPSFGLIKKSDDTATGSIAPAGTPPAQKKLGAQ
ncbi:MAG: hypothetical protein Kow0032_23030 [Methyloligellaceae bacterium]